MIEYRNTSYDTNDVVVCFKKYIAFVHGYDKSIKFNLDSDIDTYRTFFDIKYTNLKHVYIMKKFYRRELFSAHI
jgi:hypothetical protein